MLKEDRKTLRKMIVKTKTNDDNNNHKKSNEFIGEDKFLRKRGITRIEPDADNMIIHEFYK